MLSSIAQAFCSCISVIRPVAPPFQALALRHTGTPFRFPVIGGSGLFAFGSPDNLITALCARFGRFLTQAFPLYNLPITQALSKRSHENVVSLLSTPTSLVASYATPRYCSLGSPETLRLSKSAKGICGEGRKGTFYAPPSKFGRQRSRWCATLCKALGKCCTLIMLHRV